MDWVHAINKEWAKTLVDTKKIYSSDENSIEYM